MNNAETMQKQLAEVNARLKRGEGWVGYRFSKNSSGEKVPSKFLYYAFYQGATQKFVNSKTNDPEEAYRGLLKARNQIAEGDKVLPSDVSKLRYEDLKKILTDYYREHKPASLYLRKTEDGGTEETFLGADKLDHYFKRCPVPEITAQKIQGYIAWRKKAGDADATIRRQLGRLRSAFSHAKELDLLTDNHIPSFVLPKDSTPRTGFLDLPDFNTLRANFPEHLRSTLTFLYYSGCRIGAAQKITWAMVAKDCSEIELPAEIVKNRESLTIPLAGPLEEIAISLREMRKKFPKSTDAVFNFKNFRWAWDKTCCQLGLGTFDPQTKKYSGLVPHDFRRSAARNLIKAGVDRRTAMKITGHKTESIFERYNIKTTEDVKEALVRVGQYKSAAVTQIAQSSGTR